MLAIIAAIIFALAAFNVAMGQINVVALGLAVLALHFVIPLGTTYIGRLQRKN